MGDEPCSGRAVNEFFLCLIFAIFFISAAYNGRGALLMVASQVNAARAHWRWRCSIAHVYSHVVDACSRRATVRVALNHRGN